MLQKINYSGAFADALVDVLGTFMDEPAEVKLAQSVNGVLPLQEVSVLLGITGRAEGRLLLEFSRKTALKVCEMMNFGEPFVEFDEMAVATLCELANLAGGRAITLLNGEGGDYSIAPPTFLCGENMTTSGNRTEVLVVPVETQAGTIVVNVLVSES